MKYGPYFRHLHWLAPKASADALGKLPGAAGFLFLGHVRTEISGAFDEGSGAQLEALVRAEGFGDQPNPFDGKIAREMSSGVSETWQARYESHLRGEAIAVPYPLVDISEGVQA
jgi:hypothetical protein